MHPRMTELLDHLDRQRLILRAAVDSISPDRWQRRPSPEGWSVAEVLEHLSLVEFRLANLFTTKLAEARAQGLAAEPDDTPLDLMRGMDGVGDREQKVATGEVMQPKAGLDGSAAWAALDDARRAMRAALISGDGLALGQISHPHPRFGPLDLYQWAAFLGWHEARHAAQIREIALS
jgi:DinB superfamily